MVAQDLTVNISHRVILKIPSRSPRAMHLLISLIEDVFSTDEIMPLGNIMPLDEILKYRYDFIFCTGNQKLGKKVMHAAAEHITPLALELGGKNPCIVAPGSNLKTSARRIIWSKFINAGQSCIAPDYLIVHRDLKSELIIQLNKYIRKFYGDHPLEELKIASMPDRASYERICRLISSGRLIVGGDRDPRRLAIEPTVIDQLSPDAEIFKYEIFGPVLPVMEFFSDEELLIHLKKRERPLAVYCFGGSSFLHQNIRDNISAGSIVFNDAMIQFANCHFPFGGIGSSGFGSYHGKLTFETFCHRKPVMFKPSFPDLPPRYPDSPSLLKRLLGIKN